MANSLATAVERLSDGVDPRLDDERWRAVPATDDRAPAIVVGVVHDHPASAHRVRAVADAFDPDVVALELPRLAVPHYEHEADAVAVDVDGRYDDVTPDEHGTVPATDGGTSPAGTDEMTAAIAAAPDATVAGVDSVGWRFGVRFARLARSRDASLATVRRAAKGAWNVTRSALAVRFGRDDDHRHGGGVDHDVSPGADPSAQAADEGAQISRSRSLLGALERPEADVLLDETREATMAANVDAHRRTGGVVAVVGMEHLDRIADALA
ncbi:hypothetical protein G9C85_15700 [Halorubellus sp. JP-L1]|uniref:hypothetical protein n=1 Tax=Halorubellus sp. JP-L1 TaxID=2715753 RepID=UPI00140A59F9|nr:hypothetical protein [Halorubellus sp. JP-L1]NHN43061.1 hypothetical protein [Halorubellus sp. JP-L1]